MDQVQKNQEPSHSITARIKAYYHSYFESNIGKIKATWNGIKLVIDDKDINDLHGICTTFNSYFTEIGPTLGLASKINPPRVSFRYNF